MRRLLLIILLVLLLSLSVVASDKVSVSGYYKLFFTGFKIPDFEGMSEGEKAENVPIGAVSNRVRLKINVAPARWLAFSAAYDFSPRIQDPMLFDEALFFGAIDSGGYRVDDFSSRLYPGEGKAVSSLGIFHNLDRCFFTVKMDWADIYIGRQAIAWGSAKFVNPTDIVAPFTFNELDTEERRGVDAVRVRVPLGMMSELDVGYLPGRDFKFRNSAFYLRGKTYFWQTDASLLLTGFRENLLMGLDLTRAIGGAGTWVEAAYVIPGALAKDSDSPKKDEKNYFRLSVGADYNFGGKVYTFFEYHYSSAGEVKESYNDVFDKTAFKDGSVYLLGRHYLNIGATYEITPLIPFTGMVIVNLADGSLTFSPSVEYNIKEDIYLALGAYIGIGKRPEITTTCNLGDCTVYHSEFGAYPSMVYTSFRVYF